MFDTMDVGLEEQLHMNDSCPKRLFGPKLPVKAERQVPTDHGHCRHLLRGCPRHLTPALVDNEF